MRRIISFALAIVIGITFAACGGGSSAIDGTYATEDGKYELTLTNGEVKWKESGFLFEGIYTVDGSNVSFEIQGSGFIPSQTFEATVDGDTMTFTEGGISGKVMTKQD